MGHISKAYLVGLTLRGLMLLAPLAVVTGAVLPLGSWFGDLFASGAAEADAPPLVAGSVTAYGLSRVHGLPARVYRVGGDVFWLYSLRTKADLDNAERMQRGDTQLGPSVSGPVALARVSVLRFDADTRVLKGMYLR
jgi:hypothetical protein